MTSADRLKRALVDKGESLTPRQIKARYGVVNPYDVVYKLRNRGVRISLREHTDSKGRVNNQYRFEKRSRSR